MSKVWAVFRPVLNYEESEDVFFVCPTEAQANHCAAKMNRYLQRLADRLPQVPDSVDDPGFDAAYDKHAQMLGRARWPFGIDLGLDLSIAYANVIQVKPLAVRSPRV